MNTVWQTPEPSGVYQHVRELLLRFRDQRRRATLEAKTPLTRDVSAALDLVAQVNNGRSPA